MLGEQRVVCPACRPVQLGAGRRFPRLLPAEVRRGCHQERDGIGRVHLKRPVSGLDLAPVRQRPQRGHELHARGRLALVRLAAEDQAVRPARCADGASLRPRLAERDPAGLIAAQTNYQDLSRALANTSA